MFWRKKKENKETFKCARCGQEHDELPALGFNMPLHYDVLSDEDKSKRASFSSDFCIIKHDEQTDYFIRTVMTMQINDCCEDLDYGLWVSVSEKTFYEYERIFKTETDEPSFFGRICNEIKDYNESTVGLHVNIQVRNGGIRPELIPYESEHQLIVDWGKGISLENALERIRNVSKDNK